MKLQNRISISIYSIGLFLEVFLGGWYWLHKGDHLIWLAQLIILITLGHYMLFKGIALIMGMVKEEHRKKPPMIKILLYLIGKTVLAAVGILLVARFAASSVYTALILYIFQLIILIISIKKKAHKN